MTAAPPFAEDLVIGTPLDPAPDVTIDSGIAAQYAAIIGDPLRATLSDEASRSLTGSAERLANPALVLSVSIGQSTVATRRVIANLQYRRVGLRRPVHLGETLRTVVTPLAADWTTSGRDRAKVLLGMTLTSGDEVVCEYQRLALLPVRDPDRLTTTGLPDADAPADLASFARAVPAGWTMPAARATARATGDEWEDPLADTVSSARELVRLTQNLAATHRDARAARDGRRLVYGGHAIGLAQASLARTLPDLVTVLGWRSCDHRAPVYEDDLLTFRSSVDAVAAVDDRILVDARVNATAHRPEGDVDVLDFRPVLLLTGARP